jgi:ABC-type uncharacterized transport system permease subunit
MILLRYVLPAIVCSTAVVIVIVRGGDDIAFEAAAAFMGAGLSIWLLNVFFRYAVDNEHDREDEEEARRYFDAHGRWPDEAAV